ncbi:hypothetical protein ACS2MN_15955 [Bacillus cereus group sp. BceL062]|uniref:hypothetical protein n=1 Tax=Bacillus cereus group TaxID=86661 RepID=UPI003219618E
MKKIYTMTLLLFMVFIVYSAFMDIVREHIGNIADYIRVILFFLLGLFVNIILSIVIGKIFRWMGNKSSKRKKIGLYTWTGGIQDVEKDFQEIIGNSKSSKNIIYNMEELENKIKRYFYNDRDKLKRYKAYLNVVEKDNMVVVFQTFVMSILSSSFASILVTGKIKGITENLLPNMGKGLSETFYYGLGAMFLFCSIGAIIAPLMNQSDKTRVRIMQETIDICIDQLKEKEDSSNKFNG